MLADYFSDWRSRAYSCACGWTGTHEALDDALFEAVIQKSCPKCDAHLLVLSLPTGDDIRRAAAAGNEEAKEMLAQVVETERRAAECERTALRSASQLPDLAGDAPIASVWDLERGKPDNHYVIRAGEELVWRERARYEDWRRFQQVKAILREKYAARFASVTPTEDASGWLIGDSYSADLDPY